jgi:cold shock CspA family protein
MSDKKTTLRGVVKFYNSAKAYGFIVAGGYYDEIFFHISQLADDCPDPLKGDKVEFIADKGRDGRPFARQVVVLR